MPDLEVNRFILIIQRSYLILAVHLKNQNKNYTFLYLDLYSSIHSHLPISTPWSDSTVSDYKDSLSLNALLLVSLVRFLLEESKTRPKMVTSRENNIVVEPTTTSILQGNRTFLESYEVLPILTYVVLCFRWNDK